MHNSRGPNWLNVVARRLQWLAIPNIAVVLIGFQAFGFLLALSKPELAQLLPLIPELVLQGQVWRLISFLAVPMAMSPIWMLFGLWFQYFILNSIESEWGAFKTTFYILTSVVLTIMFSLVFGYPVLGITDLTSTFFLAAAALFPEQEIQIYFVIPVKMKFLGWLALAFLAFRFLQGDWMDRLFLCAIYSNYLIFFGPTMLYRIRDWKRRRDYKASWKRP